MGRRRRAGLQQSFHNYPGAWCMRKQRNGKGRYRREWSLERERALNRRTCIVQPFLLRQFAASCRAGARGRLKKRTAIGGWRLSPFLSEKVKANHAMRLPRRVPWASIGELEQLCSWIYTDDHDLESKVLAINRVR